MCEEVVSGNDVDGHGKRSDGRGSAGATNLPGGIELPARCSQEQWMRLAVPSFRMP